MEATSAMQHRLKEFMLSIAAADPAVTRASYMSDTQLTIDILQALGYLTVAEVEDTVGVTTEGRLFAGLRPDGVPDLSVAVAEVTGNIAESELVGRYLDEKIKAIDSAITKHDAPRYYQALAWSEAYQHIAIVLKATAEEIRMGLHQPVSHIGGRIIPYNDDRGTGIMHAPALEILFKDIYERNVKAGWWTDLNTGLRKKRNIGELMILIVTELTEAYEAWSQGAPDDKLPKYPGLGVELGDTIIRLADLCGALMDGALIQPSPHVFNPGDEMFDEIMVIAKRYESIRKTPAAVGEIEVADFLEPMDIPAMIDAKLDFNATRADHKIENRLKDDGKKT